MKQTGQLLPGSARVPVAMLDIIMIDGWVHICSVEGIWNWPRSGTVRAYVPG